MKSAERFRLAAPAVVADVIEGEAVMIDLDRGCYYGTDEVGGDIWAAVVRGATLATITRYMISWYEGDDDEIEAAVLAFVELLRAEGLLVVDGSPGDEATPPPAARGHGRQLFTTPRLEKYGNLQELLDADPVPELDATGSPRPRTSRGD